MAIRILTDSASDISQERAKDWNIKVLPLRIRFQEEEFLDGVTLSPEGFYEKLSRAQEIPKTSQISPYEYEKEFQAAAEAGDELICFTISSGVSGTYESACIAAREFEDIVTVIDTAQFCISQGIIVKRAADLRDEGYSAKEIVQTMRRELKEAHVVAVFNTLEYLKLGGRLSAASAFAGQLLSIKPVLTIEEGKVKILAKARGVHKSNKMLTEFIKKTGEIDFERPVALGYAGSDDSRLKSYLDDAGEILEAKEGSLPVAKVGATIGTYSGPDAIAVAFFSKNGGQ